MVTDYEASSDKMTVALKEITYCLGELRTALRKTNDPTLNERLSEFDEVCTEITERQLLSLQITVADEVAGLLEGLRSIDVPVQMDDDIGRTESLKQLRSAQGLVVMSLVRAAEEAASLGFAPKESAIGVIAGAHGDFGLTHGLRSVASRIEKLEQSLNALERSQSSGPSPAQQEALSAELVQTLRGEAKLVHFLLKAENPLATLPAVVRTLSAMAERTANFWATIRDWKRPVEELFKSAADRVRIDMKRAVKENDRRHFIPEVASGPWLDERGNSRFAEFREWLRSGGLEAIAYWAKTFEDYVKPGEHAPRSEHKREVVTAGLSEAARAVREVAERLANYGRNDDDSGSPKPAACTLDSMRAYARAKAGGGRVMENEIELLQQAYSAGALPWDDRFKIDGKNRRVVINAKLLEQLDELITVEERRDAIRKAEKNFEMPF